MFDLQTIGMFIKEGNFAFYLNINSPLLKTEKLCAEPKLDKGLLSLE